MTQNSSSVYFDLEMAHATDFVPDALAAQALRGLIHEQDEKLKGLDGEIAQLRLRLHSLQEQRAEVAKHRDLHRAFLAPIRKLAPEILGEVFIQCLLDPRDSGPMNRCSIHDGPEYGGSTDVRFHLLQVCQRWRRIAIGTPGLWTVLCIRSSELKYHDPVQMCLENSGCLPIHVHLDRHTTEGSGEIRLLLNNFHRVGEIKACAFPLIWGVLCRDLDLQTPRLKVVRLVGGSFHRDIEDNLVRLENIIQAPPIESLELKDCACLLLVFCRTPGKLQHLKIEVSSDPHVYTPALLDILPFSSSLRSLDLQLPSEMTAIREDVPTITLPCLRLLSVQGQVDEVCRLLGVLDLPSLDSLTLRMSRLFEADSAILWIRMQSFLRGDPPQLRSLTLENISLEHGFVDFISRLSHLEYLRLDVCYTTAEHFGALILDSHIPRDKMVCPRLASLFVEETTLPGEVLVQVVQSRAPLSRIPAENRCLRSVEALYSCPEDHCVALEDIEKACGGHLALNLQPRGSWGISNVEGWGNSNGD